MNKDYNALKRLHDATNSAVKKLEEKNADLRAKIMILEAEKKQWEIEKINQQTIIQQSLNQSNADSQRYREEIEELKERLKNGNKY